MTNIDRPGGPAAGAAASRKTELWMKFASTGRIADYLAYSRFDENGGNAFPAAKNSDRTRTP